MEWVWAKMGLETRAAAGSLLGYSQRESDQGTQRGHSSPTNARSMHVFATHSDWGGLSCLFVSNFFTGFSYSLYPRLVSSIFSFLYITSFYLISSCLSVPSLHLIFRSHLSISSLHLNPPSQPSIFLLTSTLCLVSLSFHPVPSPPPRDQRHLRATTHHHGPRPTPYTDIFLASPPAIHSCLASILKQKSKIVMAPQAVGDDEIGLNLTETISKPTASQGQRLVSLPSRTPPPGSRAHPRLLLLLLFLNPEPTPDFYSSSPP
jgi:hypothetical protein